MSQSHVVIVSGAGRYADPWHPFERTSEALARVASDSGLDVAVDDQVDARLAAPRAHLLVVNIGMPAWEDADADAHVREGLLAHVADGRSILAVHSSITSLQAVPEWPAVLGGTWRRGRTMHPPQSTSSIEISDAASPLTAGLRDFVTVDERYSWTDVDPQVKPLLAHRFEGAVHPLAWLWRAGPGSTGVSLLGHDEGAYESTELRTVLGRMMEALVRDASVSAARPTR